MYFLNQFWTNFYKKVIKLVCYFLLVKNAFSGGNKFFGDCCLLFLSSQWSLLLYPSFLPNIFIFHHLFWIVMFLDLCLIVSNKFSYSLFRALFFEVLFFKNLSYKYCFFLDDPSIPFGYPRRQDRFSFQFDFNFRENFHCNMLKKCPGNDHIIYWDLLIIKFLPDKIRVISSWIIDFSVNIILPPGIYLLEVNNRNTRTRCEIYWNLTIKTPKRSQWAYSPTLIKKMSIKRTFISSH